MVEVDPVTLARLKAEAVEAELREHKRALQDYRDAE